MGFRSLIKKYWKVACLIVGCWFFMALLFTPQTYLTNLRSPTPLTWGQAFLATLLLFQVWSVLTPVLLWLGARFPLERPRLLRNLAIHILLSGPVALAHIWLLQTVNTLLLTWARSYESPVPVTALLIGLGATNIMVYWASSPSARPSITFANTRNENSGSRRLNSIRLGCNCIHTFSSTH